MTTKTTNSKYRRYAYATTYTATCGVPSTVTVTRESNGVSVGSYRTSTGTPVPGYRSKIARHESATSVYTAAGHTVRILREPSGSIRWPTNPTSGWVCAGVSRPWNRYTVFTFGSGFPFPELSAYSPSTTALIQQANSQAMARLGQAVQGSKISLAVTARELRETLQLITNPFGALTKLTAKYARKWRTTAEKHGIRYVRKGSRWEVIRPPALNKRKLARDLRSAYLEYQYGAKPLVADVIHGAEAVAEVYLNRPSIFRRVEGSGQALADANPQITSGLTDRLSSPLRYDKRIDFSTTVRVRYKGELEGDIYVPDVNPVRDAARAFGLTAESFVPSLWDALPWSFFLDMFVNIGDVLDGFNALFAHYAWKCHSVSVKNRSVVSYAPNMGASIPLSPLLTGGVSPGVLERVDQTYARDESLDPVSLVLRVPGTVTGWTNTVALVTQLFSGTPGRGIRGIR